MRNPIHLHTLDHLEIKASSKRLNLFPGRAMSEAAFDKSQNYITDRIAPLLAGVWPGIQQGLEVDFLSKDDQVAASSALRYTPGKLTEMAYDSYSPVYPAVEIMPGYKHLRGNYGDNQLALEESVEETEQGKIEPLFRVKSGSAVTASGTVVKLFHPLEVKWSDLIARSGMTNNKNISGLFMLCLGREIIPVDYDEAPACRRQETDPGRDSRFETIGTLSLVPVNNFLFSAPDLKVDGRHKTINRFLSQLISGPQQPELPSELATLGLVSISEQKPVWFEMNGCRIMSEQQGLPLAFLTHTDQVLKEFVSANQLANRKKSAAINSLVKNCKLNFKFLPSAGSLPRDLLRNISSIDHPKLPGFAIDHPGLRVDMIPVPVSGVAGILRRELSRGVIDFSATTKERMRLLIAVPDGDFEPNLLDVPISDKALSDQLYEYGIQAYDTWLAWREQLGKIYNQDGATGVQETLTAEEIKQLELPDLNSDEFIAPIAPANPDLPDVSPDKISAYKPEYFFDGLIYKHGKNHKVTKYTKLPPPYREGVPKFNGYSSWLASSSNKLPLPVNEIEPGLIIRRSEIENDIVNRTDELEQANDFIDKINDLLLLQRQQLDAQSVSFATFAGGVAGDGSGMQLTRWLPFVSFNTDTATATGDTTLQKKKLLISKPGIKADAESEGGGTEKIKNPDIGNAESRKVFTGAGISDFSFSGSETYYAKPPDNFESKFDFKGTDFISPTPASVSAVSSPAGSVKGFSLNSFEPDFGFINKGKSFPVFGYKSNNAYAKIAEDKVTSSNYEAVSKLSSGVGKLGLLNGASSPLTKGSFTSANLDFGVLKHVPLIEHELGNSHLAVSQLMDDIDELLKEINNFITKDLPQHIKVKASTTTKLELLERLSLPSISGIENAFPNAAPEEKISKSNALRYGHMFNTNRSLIKEISGVDTVRNRLIKIQKVLQKYIVKQQARLEKADSEIIAERKILTQLDADRREALEDYSAAQRLVIEHWQAVEEKFDKRNKILNEMLGLYYVKTRETSTSVSLPSMHSLAYAEVGDLVPGCRSDDRNEDQITLPDELDVFFDAVLDIPMIHWQPLSALTHKLPGRYRLLSMLERRDPRLQSKQRQLSRNFTSRIRGFSELRRQTLFVMHSFSERRYNSVHSLRNLQLEAANVLSLEDLLNNSAGGRLRKPAQQLSNDLQLACSCLLEKLNELPPSVRLTWGQLAEDDQLPVKYPEKWPDIDKAEDVAFNSLRTCLELVGWFNRQLSKRAEGDSHTALTNLIRACLMLAASDDPGDILEGQLQVSPGVLRLGNVLRLDLNQEAVPGAMLQLLDERKKAVALLRLDDQDNDGASATVINLLEERRDFNTHRFRVIGHKYKHV